MSRYRPHVVMIHCIVSIGQVWPDPEYVEKEYSERSLFMLSRQNGLRRLAMSALEHPWWDRGVMAFIFLNTIVLLMFDPFDTEDILPLTGTNIFSGKSWPPLTAQALGYVGQFFSALFIAECLVRIVARGFILDHRSYLRRDGTNVLDFFIVLIGALDLLPMGNVGVNLDSLRLFRILRVMRTFTTFPELRSLVLASLRSPFLHAFHVSILGTSLMRSKLAEMRLPCACDECRACPTILIHGASMRNYSHTLQCAGAGDHTQYTCIVRRYAVVRFPVFRLRYFWSTALPRRPPGSLL
jgi:hypothetical protein